MKEVTIFLIILTFILTNIAYSQCADLANIYSFTYEGRNYEIVKENKTWIDAAACAVERGGSLAEIDSQAEQDTVYSALQIAGINLANTVAIDGGGASYVWLGGNDIATEGNWIWDGDNDGTGSQFWQGDWLGSVVGGLYNNWGSEPDDWNFNQDGLGLALTQWPLASGALGAAGQWNDVNHNDMLYYVIEFADTTGIQQHSNLTPEIHTLHQNYPNPFNPKTTISYQLSQSSDVTLTIFNLAGQEIETLVNGFITEGEHQIEWVAEGLSSGIYYYRLQAGDFTETKQLVLQK